MTIRTAVWRSIAWLAAGMAVGLPLLGFSGSDRAVGYWAVYVLERSLSLDNVFIFLLILGYFEVSREHRLRVVHWGIAFALGLRAAAVGVGGELIDRFSAVAYVLGGVLLVLAVRMLRSREHPIDPEQSAPIRIVRRLVPLTSDSTSGRFVARSGDGWALTTLGLTLVAFVVADLTFAVDSISGAFGITTDRVAIWLANALALAGLVPLLVLVRALVRHFRYMSQTLAAALGFIAIRLLTEDVVEVGPLVSLACIAGILGVGIAISVAADRLAPPSPREQAERRPPRCPPDHAGPRPSVAGT